MIDFKLEKARKLFEKHNNALAKYLVKIGKVWEEDNKLKYEDCKFNILPLKCTCGNDSWKIYTGILRCTGCGGASNNDIVDLMKFLKNIAEQKPIPWRRWSNIYDDDGKIIGRRDLDNPSRIQHFGRCPSLQCPCGGDIYIALNEKQDQYWHCVKCKNKYSNINGLTKKPLLSD